MPGSILSESQNPATCTQYQSHDWSGIGAKRTACLRTRWLSRIRAAQVIQIIDVEENALSDAVYAPLSSSRVPYMRS